MKYVLVPADKPTNSVVVVWLLYYGDTLKRGLMCTNASLSERVVVLNFDVKAKENQDNVPTLYWLPKLHRNPIKQD